jgi:TPR repeat protein
MRNLTATLCLTLAVLLGSAGVSESADFQKGLTAYKSGDYATALREWTPLAEQGNAVAQYNLGVMYRKGKGVPQNHKTAVKWYRLSAEQGDADAQSNLNKIQSRLVSKGIDDCLFDEIEKVTGPETRRIVEKHCRRKMEKKSLDWLLRKFN